MKTLKTLTLLLLITLTLSNCQKEIDLNNEILQQTTLEKISQQNKIFFDKLEGLKSETQKKDINFKLEQIVNEYQKSNIASSKDFQKKKH